MNKIKYNFYDKNTVEFNTTFVDDIDFNWVAEHNFNVRYTETRSSKFVEIINEFQRRGYVLKVVQEPVVINGLEISPNLIAFFLKN